MINVQKAALYSISAAAFIFAVSGTASAQGMAGVMTQKTLSENAKLAVFDMVAKPGETSPIQARPMRVVYIISGGTFERTFADGKKEVIEEKAGETKILDVPKPYALKNIGKTTIHGVIVSMK